MLFLVCDVSILVNHYISPLQHCRAKSCDGLVRAGHIKELHFASPSLALFAQRPATLVLTALFSKTLLSCLWMFLTISVSAARNSVTACC
jgi:hypothetical protein